MSAVRAFKNANIRKVEKGWDTLYILLDIHATVMKPNWEGVSVEFYPHCIEALQEISKDPTYKIIMWTCSKEEDRNHYKKLLEDKGIPIYAINSNPDTEGVLNWGDYSQKLYCNILLDDKAGFDAETEWVEILNYLNPSLFRKFRNKIKKIVASVKELFGGSPSIYVRDVSNNSSVNITIDNK